MSGRLTQFTLHALDWLRARTLAPDASPLHQQIGRRGEEDAYFYLRRLGYVMVARNFRAPRRRGEIDLIGWDRDTLCFIEVKTRTTKDVKPGEAAVDRDKQQALVLVAREYLRLLPKDEAPAWRFDVLSVYYPRGSGHAQFELFQSAFAVS